MGTTPAGPDLDTMKQVNRQFVTGVTVVTAMDDGKPRGLAVNAFSSVSLDPPTVMVAVQRTSSFAGLDWEPGPYGSPLINRSGAQMEVEIRERLQASTHTLFVCRVVHATASDRHPMVYSAGKFFDGGALPPLG